MSHEKWEKNIKEDNQISKPLKDINSKADTRPDTWKFAKKFLVKSENNRDQIRLYWQYAD